MAKLEFPGGAGVQNKSLLWGEYGYILELHIVHDHVHVNTSIVKNFYHTVSVQTYAK